MNEWIDNRIKTKGFLYLLTLMKEGKFPLLWELDVSGKILDEGKLDIGNELDDKCVTEMTAFLRNNPTLSSLHIVNFENNAISPAVLQEFKTVLAASYSEHWFFISCCLFHTVKDPFVILLFYLILFSSILFIICIERICKL